MDVNFYQRKRGDYPVKNFINELDDAKLRVKILDDLNSLEKYGYQQLLKTRDAKKLKGYKNLYELITNHRNLYSRIFFSILKNKIWLLHGFLKKTNKTPLREINNALNNRYDTMIKLKSKNK